MEPQVKHETEEKHEHEHEHPGETSKPPTYEDLLEIIESQRQQLQKASIAIEERDQVIKERDQTIEQMRGSTSSALVANPSATTMTGDSSINTSSTMDPSATISAADRIAELEEEVRATENLKDFYKQREEDLRELHDETIIDKMNVEDNLRRAEQTIRGKELIMGRMRTDLNGYIYRYGPLNRE